MGRPLFRGIKEGEQYTVSIFGYKLIIFEEVINNVKYSKVSELHLFFCPTIKLILHTRWRFIKLYAGSSKGTQGK